MIVVRVIVEVAEAPASIDMEAGLEEIEKSGEPPLGVMMLEPPLEDCNVVTKLFCESMLVAKALGPDDTRLS